MCDDEVYIASCHLWFSAQKIRMAIARSKTLTGIICVGSSQRAYVGLLGRKGPFLLLFVIACGFVVAVVVADGAAECCAASVSKTSAEHSLAQTQLRAGSVDPFRSQSSVEGPSLLPESRQVTCRAVAADYSGLAHTIAAADILAGKTTDKRRWVQHPAREHSDCCNKTCCAGSNII